jgi:hypothetical protein
VGYNCRNITDIDNLVGDLSHHTRELFHRIFSVTSTVGTLLPPESMMPWIEQQFGSVGRVTKQKIVKITNLFTFEGAMFNSLRALRPRQLEDRLKVEARILDRVTDDPLVNPYNDTPEDPFGRVK